MKKKKSAANCGGLWGWGSFIGPPTKRRLKRDRCHLNQQQAYLKCSSSSSLAADAMKRWT
jgi:hypothetical protein